MKQNIDQKNSEGKRENPKTPRRLKGIKLSWAEIVALVIVIFCLGFLTGRTMDNTGEYKGLGDSKEIPLNEYDKSAFTRTDEGRLQYEDDKYTSVNVIDVSYAQKDISWDRVASDGIDMAMIRLGYRGYSSGLLNLDEYFEQNIQGARDAGLEYGVYFFSQAVSVEEAREEAQFVIENIKGRKVTGPVAFDMEPIKGADRISYLTVEEKTAIADAFLSYIEKKGYTAMLYGNPKWLKNEVDLSRLTNYPLWLAHYTEMTGWPYKYVMWQYTDKGEVSGIEGDVDMSIRLVEK
ncbi:MAG: glycoside hydrolase family 25 protein [Firmicutes bacterium]|nr:glycoside hydrolase family 25 protein [Bacillota bacterium]